MTPTLGLLLLTLPLAPAAPPPAPVVRAQVIPESPARLPAPAEVPGTALPPTGLPPTGLAYVRILPPEGSTVVWYPALTTGFSAGPNTTLGLRPGYTYRLALLNLPDQPKDLILFPSIELRGLVSGPRGFDASRFPIPIQFTLDDIDAVLRGRLVTKVFLLEDPDTALPVQSKPNEPIELRAGTEEEALKEARKRGRPLMIVRIGERTFSDRELAAEHTPGTVIAPGMNPLPMPTLPPQFPYGLIPLYDPIAGPKLSDLECLHDGGDEKLPLGILNDGTLGGLDPADTALQYTTAKGNRKVATSNKVCICVPRYIAYRVETGLEGIISLDGPRLDLLIVPPQSVKARVPALAVRELGRLSLLQNRLRPSIVKTTQTTLVMREHNAPQAVAQVRGVKVVAEVLELEEITRYPTCKLILQKWVEPTMPTAIGEEVTFFLRFNNSTQSSMTDIVVSDSLTARLEYIPGTAKSDRAATLTVAENEAGSVTLRWAVSERLAPGESGLISFKARIR